MKSRRLVLITILAGSACIDRGEVLHPPEFTGRWVRLRADGSWGDTLDYLADGTVRGSVGHAVPDSAQWALVRSRVGGEALCVRDVQQHACRPFRLAGDTMVVGYVSSPTFFRRVR